MKANNIINHDKKKWITKTNREYKATHQTKYGFGGLLPAGIKVNIVKSEGNDVAVLDHCSNIWHGKFNDLKKIIL